MSDGPTTGAGGDATPARREFVLGGLFGGMTGGLIGTATGAAIGRMAVPYGDVNAPLLPPVIIEKQLPIGTALSYSQYGEDLVAASLFDSIKISRPTYLDIGAFEPIHSNNTYLFYTRGARGVLVEPNIALADKTRGIRPEDKLLVAGIGLTDATEADYYVMSEPQQNTFDKSHAEKFVQEKGYKLLQVIKLPLININRAIAENFGGAAPDYLSIDVEGIEFAILKSLDLKRFRPKVVCIETLIANTLQHDPAITEYMTANGYEPRGMSYPNTLYVDKQLLKAKDKK